MNWRDHIEQRPDVMLGKPVFKGTRLTVELILERLGDGATEQDLLAAYPNLRPEHIRAARLFAAEALVHVDYEYNQFMACKTALDAAAQATDQELAPDRTLNNAVLESALLHVRNLIHFFDKSDAPEDDILARHFVPDTTKLQVTSAVKMIINKRLSHLTYSRCFVADNDRIWRARLDDLVPKIRDAYNRFSSAVANFRLYAAAPPDDELRLDPYATSRPHSL